MYTGKWRETYLDARDHRHHGHHPVGRACGRDLEVGVRFQSVGFTSPQDRRTLDTKTTGQLIGARAENSIRVVGILLNPLHRYVKFRRGQCLGCTGRFERDQFDAVKEVLLCRNALAWNRYWAARQYISDIQSCTA